MGIIISVLLGMLLMAIAAFAAMKRRLRDLLDIVHFNIQGANPMVRLVPNVSYTLLFLLLLSLTTRGGDAFTTAFAALN